MYILKFFFNIEYCREVTEMASRQPERYIPHVCDVFRLPSNTDLRDSENNVSSDRTGKNSLYYSDKKYVPYEDHSDEDHYDYDGGRLHQKGRSGNSEISNSVRAGRHNNYCHALTEKDIQHIERHLSMKKTIRKQLSRHLSQAFVENESKTGNKQNGERDDRPDGRRTGSGMPAYGLTFSRSNVAKSETNFLDLLKEVHEDEDDSGHCSPTRDMESDVIRGDYTKGTTKPSYPKSGGGGRSNISGVSKMDNSATDDQFADTKKSGFWKKLTVRGKSKR